MRLIREYPVAGALKLPVGAVIRGLHTVGRTITLLAEIDPGENTEVRYFVVVDKETALPDYNNKAMAKPPEYLGSALYGLVLEHCYEVFPTSDKPADALQSDPPVSNPGFYEPEEPKAP